MKLNKKEMKEKCKLCDSNIVDALGLCDEDEIITINQLLDKMINEIGDHTYLGKAQLMVAIEVIRDRVEKSEDIEKATRLRKILHGELEK